MLLPAYIDNSLNLQQSYIDIAHLVDPDSEVYAFGNTAESLILHAM